MVSSSKRIAAWSSSARAASSSAKLGTRLSGGASSGTCGRHDGFELDVVAQPLDAELATEARRLVAAERRDEVHRVLVHAVGAGAHAPGDVESAVDVAGPDRAG